MRLFSGRFGYGVGYYRIEGSQSWILCVKFPRFGLIHLASPYWWKPIIEFPLALFYHLRALFAKADKK